MLKRNKIALGALGALVLVVVTPIAVLAFVATFDWNHAKPWVQSRESAALGRSVEIAGDLTAAWHWRQRENGVQVWSPGLRFSGGGVRIGNPDWARQPHFAELKALDIELRLLPLLWRHLDIPSIRLVQPSLDFEQRKDGRATWLFAPAQQQNGQAWGVDLGDIEFDAGEVHIADEARALELHADIVPLEAPIEFGQRVEGDDPTTRREVIRRVGQAAAQRLRAAAEERETKASERGKAAKPPPYLFGWKASGTMAGAAVKGSGRFGGVLALKQPKPFPLRADIDIGTTEIALTGTITDPTSPDAVDMRLWIS
ncbi:MAG TPA: AsmA family protein, partial [Dokdonella sp.]